MKETKTAKGGTDCSTLLHYLARVLLRTDPTLVQFVEEMPHLEAAARGHNPSEMFPHLLTCLHSVFADNRSNRQLFGLRFKPDQRGNHISARPTVFSRRRSLRRGDAGSNLKYRPGLLLT
jgi:hypothetical protein